MTIDIADVQREGMADYLLGQIQATGMLLLYASDGTLANHTAGKPDDPTIPTDATVLAEFSLTGADTPNGNGRIDWTLGGTLTDSTANATGTVAWARFMTATEYAKAANVRVGIVDCDVSTMVDGTGDIQLNSVDIVAGGIVSITQLYHDIS